MAVGVEVEVISRRRSAPNQRVVTNPIITLAAMIAMVIRAWGLMQEMAAIMAVALKYDTSMFFLLLRSSLLASCNILVKIEHGWLG